MGMIKSMKQTFVHRLGIGLVAISLVFTGASCRKGCSIEAQQAFKNITLQYWTVFNSPEHFQSVIADYQAIHPNIKIEVKKFRF